mmetsp:Transcript_9763/g.17064  ORF Transcript_9763/g.17064 Transcript_9763/m.17064 type:complete len:496 (+) Transcript_9763:178-1665(+)
MSSRKKRLREASATSARSPNGVESDVSATGNSATSKSSAHTKLGSTASTPVQNGAMNNDDKSTWSKSKKKRMKQKLKKEEARKLREASGGGNANNANNSTNNRPNKQSTPSDAGKRGARNVTSPGNQSISSDDGNSNNKKRLRKNPTESPSAKKTQAPTAAKDGSITKVDPLEKNASLKRSSDEDQMLANDSSPKNKKKKKKKKKAASRGKPGLREGSHTDAVMGLSWNTVHPQVLASGSADGTVKLWDVTSNASDYVRPSSTLTHHTDKVQSLAWHPTEGTLLATGGYDRKVCLVDARSPSNVKKAKLLADCEAIVWDPHNPQYLTAASEDGVVQCWDVRNFGGDPVWSMVAHEYGGVSDICYNSKVPGMLISCSIDKTVALWDTSAQNQPQPCGSKDMNVGKLYSVSIYPSSPWLLSCGGSGNELAIWDMEHEDAIRNRFAGRIGESIVAPEGEEPDFEAAMATGDDVATALESMNKSKKKKGKKKNKAHKRK